MDDTAAKRSGRSMVAIGLLVAAMVVVAAFLPRMHTPRFPVSWWLIAWIINIGLMLAIIAVIGQNNKQDPGWLAILVDGRRMHSLSRLQITLWTVLVLSAFFTIAVTRAVDSLNLALSEFYVCPESESGDALTLLEPGETAAGADAGQANADASDESPCAGPAALQLPATLWALMGISVTSAVASPLIKTNKANRTKKDQDTYYNLVIDEANEAAREAGDDQVIDSVGAVAIRAQGPPRLSDLFVAEDPAGLEQGLLDMGKVQNFFFTVIVVVVYAAVLGAAIARAPTFWSLYQFPDLSAGLVAILGISHAGYLVNKNADVGGPEPAGGG
jgi:hypothetical protein